MTDTGEIVRQVTDLLGGRLLETKEEHGWAVCMVAPADWTQVGEMLCSELGYNYLASLTAVDLKDTFEVVAHLHAIDDGELRKVAVKCRLDREAPSLDTLSNIWMGANWHERETHELFGIDFAGHPCLSHLLLPDDWEGYPLRKDYVDPA